MDSSPHNQGKSDQLEGTRMIIGQLGDYQTRDWLVSRSLYVMSASVLLFLWIPLLVMLLLSFGENAITIFPFEGFTLEHYVEMLNDERLLQSAWRSIKIATLSATIATLLAVPASFILARLDFPFKETYRIFSILPLVIPGVVLGMALLIYFRTVLGLTPGILTILLTHGVYGFPFVLLVVTARLYSFDEALEEAARDLGAGLMTTFRDITLPIIAPAVAAGFLFAWLRSFEDFIRVFFVRGTVNVLTTTMYSMIQYGASTKMNAISTVVVIVIALILVVGIIFGNLNQIVTDPPNKSN
jgi:ABC-type spermidine/putrescine transport system permease subunit II